MSDLTHTRRPTQPTCRVDQDGNAEYVDASGDPYGHAAQVEFARVDRYMASIEAAKLKGRKIDANWLPKDLEPEFYGDSIGDTLAIQVGVLSYLQDTLSMNASEEPLGEDATRGLFYILQGAIDNAARAMAFIEATKNSVAVEVTS